MISINSIGEVLEIDVEITPPALAPESPSRACNYESLSSLKVRTHPPEVLPNLKKDVREVLDQMGNAPAVFSDEMNASNEAFLDHISKHIQNAEEFVAGSFQHSYPAWEELLKESKRQMSKKVSKWI